MKRHLKTVNLALCCVLLVAASLFAQAPAQSQGTAAKPKAVAVEPVKELGLVPKGEQATHEFTIRNEGNAPLQIQEVRAACGCTVADYDKVIAPGQTGKVRMSVDTTTFSGPIAKGVTVFTNDPATPQIELTVRANVEPFIKVSPGYARYSMVQGEKEGKITQTLWTPDKSPMQIVKVESPYPYLKVSFREAKPEERNKAAQDQQQWVIDMVLASDAPVGPLTEPVKVHTNSTKQKLVQIPVSGFVRPVIAVTPSVVDFGPIEIKEEMRKTFNVRSFATEPIKLTSIQDNIQGIDASYEPLQDGREYQIRLTLKPELAKGPFNGKLVITTDSPKVPRLEVEVKGTKI